MPALARSSSTSPPRSIVQMRAKAALRWLTTDSAQYCKTLGRGTPPSANAAPTSAPSAA